MQVSQKTRSQTNEGCAPRSPSPHSSSHRRSSCYVPPQATLRLRGLQQRRRFMPAVEHHAGGNTLLPSTDPMHIRIKKHYYFTSHGHVEVSIIDLRLFRGCRSGAGAPYPPPLVTASGSGPAASASGSAAAGRGTPRGWTRARARPRIGTT